MVLDSLKKLGRQVVFQYGLEYFNGQIVEVLRDFLKSYTPRDVPRMVRKNEFPSMDETFFARYSGFIEEAEKVPAERLMQAIYDARPDIAQAIERQGKQGAMYIIRLREHMLNLMRNPVSISQQAKLEEPVQDMVKATCDVCKQSWPVPREEFDKITECPFCHAGKDEPTPSGSQN